MYWGVELLARSTTRTSVVYPTSAFELRNKHAYWTGEYNRKCFLMIGRNSWRPGCPNAKAVVCGPHDPIESVACHEFCLRHSSHVLNGCKSLRVALSCYLRAISQLMMRDNFANCPIYDSDDWELLVVLNLLVCWGE